MGADFAAPTHIKPKVMSELSKEGIRLSDIAFEAATKIHKSAGELSRVDTAELVTTAIIEAVRPYADLVKRFIEEFPELEDKDEPLGGADSVDRICELYPHFKELTE